MDHTLSENENISLSTTPESGFGNYAGLNELHRTFSFKDEFQQLKEGQVAILPREPRKKDAKYKIQRKTSDFLRKKLKDRDNQIEKILKDNEELRIDNKELHTENKELYKHLKCLEEKVQNLAWGAERTNQDSKKDIKDLQDKVEKYGWILDDINRDLTKVTNEVEGHTAQIDGLERVVRPEDA